MESNSKFVNKNDFFTVIHAIAGFAYYHLRKRELFKLIERGEG